MGYDYAHDPEQRYHSNDCWCCWQLQAEGFAYLVIGGVLIWLFGSYWFLIIPAVVLIGFIPYLTKVFTRDKAIARDTMIVGALVWMIYLTIWFFVTHPGFLEVVLGLKPY